MLLRCAYDRRWWMARWEEFEEQHEGNMGHTKQQIQQQEQYVADTDVNAVVNPRPPLSTHQDESVAESVLGQRSIPVEYRPPLRGSGPTPQARPPVPTNAGNSTGPNVSEPHWLKHVTNRAHVVIASALGQSVRRYDDLAPPGLRNPGQNVCFLNSIMQAIARTPSLPEAILQLRKQNPNDQLVWQLNSLLQQLTIPVSTSTPLVLDTRDFRLQASFEFPGGLIGSPSQVVSMQRQQDAAECLTWMVEWLHAKMNSAATSSVQLPGIR